MREPGERILIWLLYMAFFPLHQLPIVMELSHYIRVL